ncbi:MAG: YjbQ family protein [Euryarchaeota archaeon]|nr:YjbQ family protein [Euryarchaeota archaeon]
MVAYRASFSVETKGEVQTIDITERVAKIVRASRVREGIACVFTPASTAAIVANEFEPGLMETDLPAALERLVPKGLPYEHEKRWGDANGHSHLRATLLGPSVTFPVGGGEPLLGTWQQLVLVELDTRPRNRDVVVQIVGERAMEGLSRSVR